MGNTLIGHFFLSKKYQTKLHSENFTLKLIGLQKLGGKTLSFLIRSIHLHLFEFLGKWPTKVSPLLLESGAKSEVNYCFYAYALVKQAIVKLPSP